MNAENIYAKAVRNCEEAKARYPHLDPTLYDSPCEVEFALALHERGLVWAPRHHVGKYRMDFAFPKSKIDVEVDGATYHAFPDQQKRDDRRDAYLNQRGWFVVRISAHDAKFKTADAIQKVKKALVMCS